MILAANITGPNMRLAGQVVGGNVVFSSSQADPAPDDGFPFGAPFDPRTVDTTGGTGDGSFVTLAGQYWAGPADDANIGHQDGAGNQAKFYSPNGIDIGAIAPHDVFLSEFGYEPSVQTHPPDMSAGHTIRRINRLTGEVSTLAGMPGVAGYADGVGSAARFHGLVALRSTTTGLLAVEYGSGGAYQGNARLRHVSYSGLVTTVAFNGSYTDVDGPALSASMNGPNGCDMHEDGSIYVCGYSINNPTNGKVRKIANDPQRTVTTIATGLAFPANCRVVGNDLYVIGFTSGILYRINLLTNQVTVVTDQLGMNANGGSLGFGCLYYVLAGPPAPGPRIMQVTIPGGEVSAISGAEGQTSDPATNHHALSCVTFDGTYLYGGDHYGNRVTKGRPV